MFPLPFTGGAAAPPKKKGTKYFISGINCVRPWNCHWASVTEETAGGVFQFLSTNTLKRSNRTMNVSYKQVFSVYLILLCHKAPLLSKTY